MNEEPKKLFNRDYLLLWQGQSVSRIGNQAFAVGMLYWILEKTGSATLMGTLAALAAIPGVLLGPIAGTIADRHSRKAIIVGTDLVNGLAVTAFALFMLYYPASLRLQLTLLFAVSIFLATTTTFFRPAISAALPELVPKDRLTTANSLGQLSRQITVLVGQGAGGVIYAILGAPILFLIDGLSFLFSAFSEVFIRIPQHIPEKSKSLSEEFQKFKEGMRVGLHYVWQTRGIRTMMFASSFLAFLTAPVLILLPVFVRRYLNAGPEAYGFLLAAYGLGTMLGYVLAGVLGLQGRVRARVLIVLMFAEAGSYAVLGLMRSVPPALGFAVVGGALDGFVIVNLTTILQLTTPSEIRGRVFGLLGTISSGLAPIGMGLAGVVADLVHQNIPLIYISVSALMALLILAAASDSHFREYLAYRAEPRTRRRGPEPEAVPVEMVDGRIL